MSQLATQEQKVVTAQRIAWVKKGEGTHIVKQAARQVYLKLHGPNVDVNEVTAFLEEHGLTGLKGLDVSVDGVQYPAHEAGAVKLKLETRKVEFGPINKPIPINYLVPSGEKG